MAGLRLNADVGEGIGNEAVLMPLLDMANIACGGHAGDPETMAAVMQLAVQHGVIIGAHPSYPDRANFGRKSLAIPHQDLTRSLCQQLQQFVDIAHSQRVEVAYVKPHGALYNDMMRDDELLNTVLGAIADVLPATEVMLLATPEHDSYSRVCMRFGLTPIFEGFTDRGYQSDGRLLARTLEGSILDHAAALERLQTLQQRGVVMAVDGTELDLPISSLCVHGDHPDAMRTLQQLRELLPHA